MSPKTAIFGILLPLTLVTLFTMPWIGQQALPWSVITDGLPYLSGSASARPSHIDSLIFWEIRIPRVMLSMLAGMGLSLGGVVFQSIFRNSLATPFTLGVAGGASLGVTVAIFLGINITLLGVSGISLAALIGALLSISLVYGIARITGSLAPTTMLLSGVAISFFFSSIILLIQYLGDMSNSFRIIHWLMGDLSKANAETLLQITPFVFSGILIIGFMRKELNLLSLDDDIAASYGLHVEKTRLTLFLAVSLMMAGIVTVCGPIGFVGIMAPHICRLMVGANHRYLVPAAILFGGTFLTLCDTLARSLSASAEVPVGIITAIIGGPFFLILLIKK